MKQPCTPQGSKWAFISQPWEILAAHCTMIEISGNALSLRIRTEVWFLE